MRQYIKNNVSRETEVHKKSVPFFVAIFKLFVYNGKCKEVKHMITVREQLDYSTFYGLSSDIEANNHIPNKYGYLCSRYVQNGDELIIMDTGAKYLYDEANKRWLEF